MIISYMYIVNSTSKKKTWKYKACSLDAAILNPDKENLYKKVRNPDKKIIRLFLI